MLCSLVLSREVEVGVPSPAERQDILAKQLRSMAHELTAEQARIGPF